MTEGSEARIGARPSGSVRYDNTGRVVVVSGGCNGIGLAICRAFVDSKAAGVVCLDIDEAAAGNLPAGITFRRWVRTSEQVARQLSHDVPLDHPIRDGVADLEPAVLDHVGSTARRADEEQQQKQQRETDGRGQIR